MFSINKYNSDISKILDNYSPISSGGAKNRASKEAFSKMITFTLILLILILELAEPLQEGKVIDKLKQSMSSYGVFVAFIMMTLVVLISVFGGFYLVSAVNKKQKRTWGPIGIIVFLIIVHFSLTIATLVLGNAYGDNSATRKGYFYSKVVLLFGLMIGYVITTIRSMAGL